MVDFENRVAVITGAGGGLGRAHAFLLSQLGAKVVVNDPGVALDGAGSEHKPADRVVAEITAAGGTAVAEYSSVASPEGGALITQKALAEFGRIDVLINNAGILRDRSFAKMTWDELHAVLDVHLRGAFYCTNAAFPAMKEQGYGRIIMTSSASGIMGNFGQSNYGAAKMGLVGLMNVLKLEGAKYNITVNAIAPIAATRMTGELLEAVGMGADLFSPELVAPAVAYLASEDCTLTGELWSVGGGSVSRVFTGLCDGYLKDPADGPLTVDDVAAHLDAIRGEDGYLVPSSNADEFRKLAAKLHA